VDQTRDKDKQTALYLAAKEGHTKCVLLLYHKGERSNALLGPPDKHTPISVASMKGYSDCLKIMCEGGGDTEGGNAPLTSAELDAAAAIGLSALSWAIRQRKPACIRLLADAKCSLNLALDAKGFKGLTPLTMALGTWWKDCPSADAHKRVEVEMDVEGGWLCVRVRVHVRVCARVCVCVYTIVCVRVHVCVCVRARGHTRKSVPVREANARKRVEVEILNKSALWIFCTVK